MASTPTLIKRASIPPQTDLDDIVIVNTLDGHMHGMKKSNGLLIWSKMLKEGPMVEVQDHSKGLVLQDSKETGLSDVLREASQVLFIPEPAGNGNLYYVEPGKEIKVYLIADSLRNSTSHSKKSLPTMP
jgi:hypothetical protein